MLRFLHALPFDHLPYHRAAVGWVGNWLQPAAGHQQLLMGGGLAGVYPVLPASLQNWCWMLRGWPPHSLMALGFLCPTSWRLGRWRSTI